MRKLGLLFALLAASCSTDRCKDGSLFVRYALPADAETANSINVTLAIANGSPQTKNIARKSGDSSIEIDFAASYPKGQPLTVTVSALSANGVIASATQTTTAAANCTALSFTLVDTVVEGSDLGTPDLGSPADDGSVNDMTGVASPDLAGPPLDMAEPAGTLTWTPSPTPIPVPGGAIRAVWGTSASDLWVVGDYFILHGNSGVWSQAALPSGLPVGTSFKAVWGTASSDVWAVGTFGLILHFNGTSWQEVTSPVTSTINSVWVSSPQSGWAVGDDGIFMQMTNATWANNLAQAPVVNLSTIWGVSAADVWVVGSNTSTGVGQADQTMTATSWYSMGNDNSFSNITALGGSSANDIWLAGASSAGTGTAPVASHWNGTALSAPQPMPALATHLWANSASGTWAVGSNLVLRLDSTSGQWVTEYIAYGATLDGIYGFGPHDIWAVGESSSGTPVVLHGQ